MPNIDWRHFGTQEEAVDRTAFESCMSTLRQALSVMLQQAQTLDRLTRPTFIHVDEDEKKEDPCQSK